MLEARSFLLIAAGAMFVCAFIAGVRVTTPEGTTLMSVLDLAWSLLGAVYIGVAWGWAALVRTRLARAAALTQLGALLVHGALVVMDARSMATAWAWLAPNVVASMLLAMVIARRHPLLGALGVTMFAASALGWIGAQLDIPRMVERVATFVEAAAAGGLLLTARAYPIDAPPEPTALDPWRDADEGVRLVVIGELVRVGTLAAAFVLGMVLRRAGLSDAVPVVRTIGWVAALGFTLAGLLRMRASPGGRAWLNGALGLALLGLVSGVCELLAIVDELTGAGLVPGSSILVGYARHFAQCLAAPMVALALGDLGARAGIDIREEARLCALHYLVVFVGLTIGPLALALIGKGSLLTLASVFGAMIFLVTGSRKLRALSRRVRDALPAGAANDAFGDPIGG